MSDMHKIWRTLAYLEVRISELERKLKQRRGMSCRLTAGQLWQVVLGCMIVIGALTGKLGISDTLKLLSGITK